MSEFQLNVSSSEPGHFIVFKSDVPAGVIHYEIIVQRDARPREMNGLKYEESEEKINDNYSSWPPGGLGTDRGIWAPQHT